MKNSEIDEAIREYIHSEVDRQILRRRMIDGLHYDELAEEFNYSVRHIKRKVYKLQEEIFKHVKP